MAVYHTVSNLRVGDNASEIELATTVQYDFHPEHFRHDRWNPFEPSHVTIEKVTARKLAYVDKKHVEVGEPIDLTAMYESDETLLAEILDYHEGQREAARENAWETRRAERMEARS